MITVNSPRPTMKRNQTMDIIKVIAAISVVWIHVLFPGGMGLAVTCLARFAVPFFFMVSGYFSYHLKPFKAVSRMTRTLWLTLLGTCLAFFVFCILTVYQGNSLRDALGPPIPISILIAEFWVLNTNYISPHLWFLPALASCYIAIYFYVKFFGDRKPNYTPLYIVGFCLFLICLGLSKLAVAADLILPDYLYRNGLFFGFPMFAMGLFLREYSDVIRTNFQMNFLKLSGYILVGTVISFIEWRGIGDNDIHIGSVMTAGCLILMCTYYPTIFYNRTLTSLISHFDKLSLWIYLTHPSVMELYDLFLRPWVKIYFGPARQFLRPIFVALLTILLFIPIQWLLNLIRKIFTSKQSK